MANVNLATYRIEDMSVGKSFSFVKSVTEKDVNNFAELSGDTSPLHTTEDFARGRGYGGRVVHGILLASYLSKLVGVDFPGENCLLQIMNLRFLSSAYIGADIKISAKVVQVSVAANVAVLDAIIEDINTGTKLVEGKIQVGFTKVKAGK